MEVVPAGVSMTGFSSLDESPPQFIPSVEFAHALLQMELPFAEPREYFGEHANEGNAGAGVAYDVGTILDPDTAAAVGAKRLDIGIRVERTLAAIAMRAAMYNVRHSRDIPGRSVYP